MSLQAGGLACPPPRRPLAAAPLPRRLPGVRCLASKSSGDKSWSEIASEAGQLATDLAKKVGATVSNTVSKVAEAIVPSSDKGERRPQRQERERRREDVFRPEDLGFGGGLVGGLVGRAVGGMLRSAVGALGEQMRQAQEQVADVQDRAARVIQSNTKLRTAMGGSVQVLPPVSQSSMSQNINGRMTQTVTLLLPVVGPGGRSAQAQVQYVEGNGATEQLRVSVRLPNGQMMDLDASSAAAGTIIDVEYVELPDNKKK